MMNNILINDMYRQLWIVISNDGQRSTIVHISKSLVFQIDGSALTVMETHEVTVNNDGHQRIKMISDYALLCMLM
jgi:hypothetical protein